MSIEDYEFVDSEIKECFPLKYKSMVGLCFREDTDMVCIHKKDALALAKHFKLTEEDLK